MIKKRQWETRSNRCYEISLTVVLDNPDWTLVHGIIGRQTPHAWCEKDGIVYDPVIGELLNKGELTWTDYRKEQEAIVIVKYPADAAMNLFKHTRHFGPWYSPQIEKDALAKIGKTMFELMDLKQTEKSTAMAIEMMVADGRMTSEQAQEMKRLCKLPD